jgi:S-adenosylmethionine/arginine decarboxylase-like enzyme
MSFWGHHLILDCAGCNNNIKSKDQIKLFLTDLISKIDMTAVGDPVIEHLLTGEINQGFSVLQLITTSNITAHFVEHDNSAYIDVFSCKPFDIDLAQSVVTAHFDPTTVKQTFLRRQA